jgi:glutathione S-transferase
MNPNRRIPTLRDGDVVLWESNAIVRYLAAKFGAGHLLPRDPVERAIADQWMDWQQTTLNPAGRDAFMQWIRTPAAQRDAAAAARSVQATERLMALLDAHLATRAYMGGDRFTMADIPIGCELHRWFGLPPALYARPTWPHVERYFAALGARPAARGVLDLPLE